MPRLPRFLLAAALVASALASAPAQTLQRVAATALRLPADSPRAAYSTTSAYGRLRFTQPVAVLAAPGETHRLFVVEKTGIIRVVRDLASANPTSSVFLDLRSRLSVSNNTSDERGLLSLAFHPDYATNGHVFVWFTTNASTTAGNGLHNRLARFTVSANDPNLADPASEFPLLTQFDEASNHNGGHLLFGPDGYLYLSLGDEGGGNDQFGNGQRIDRDFFAAIVRLDVDRRPGSLAPNPHPAVHANSYAIPPDNPFVGATSFNNAPLPNPAAIRTEFWATGLRNPWRLAFDPANGRLWCADVGQNAREEINVVVRGGNYGWPHREGHNPGPRAAQTPANVTLIPPIWDYPRTEGASITGGFVYRGPRHPELQGHYLFADYVTSNVWALNPDDDRSVSASRIQLLTRLPSGGLSSFGLDPVTGDILLTQLPSGDILRLAVTTDPGSAFPATLSATGAFTNLASLTPAPGVVPYEPIVSFWSDHAKKTRWFALTDPASTFTLGPTPDSPWLIPTGAVWIKHFELELTRGDPSTRRPVETRFLVRGNSSFYALTYRWNATQTDATLVSDAGATQDFTVLENGVARTQTWRFPSRAECFACHTDAAGTALSFNTRQLNRTHATPSDPTNFLTLLAQAGYLSVNPTTRNPATIDPAALPAHTAPDDRTQPLELRARSYLDVNCSQCHRADGPSPSSWDARASLPLAATGIINGRLLDNAGDPAHRVLVPGDATHSQLLARIAATDTRRMPPLGSTERDRAGESLLAEWIASLAAPADPQARSRLVNLAARAPVSPNSPIIAGFVISPGSDKRILLRAIGPSLGTEPFRIGGALADPGLVVYGPNTSTRIAASNGNWDASLAPLFAATGAFALPLGSRDSALVADLSPGSYTAIVSDPSGASGVALVEIYDADPVSTVAAANFARLVNTSIRAHVGTGADVLIPGLVVGPGTTKTVLLRAVGPPRAAPPCNGPGTLAQPTLTLFAGPEPVATNAGWNNAPNAAEIRAAARTVGAFALPEGGRDSALLATLPPGNYTLQISGANNTTGTALVEIYDVP